MKKIILCTLLCAFALPMMAQEQEDVVVRRGTYQPKQTSNSNIRATEPMLRLSAGFNIYGSIALDYQVTPSFIIGGGIGITETWETQKTQGYYFDSDGNIIHQSDCEAFLPIFLEAEIRTPKYKWSLFLNLKAGTNIISFGDWEAIDKVFASIMAGFSYKNISLGVGISTMGNYNFGPIVLSLSYDIPFTTLERIFN